jgi:hypothetical protein
MVNMLSDELADFLTLFPAGWPKIGERGEIVRTEDRLLELVWRLIPWVCFLTWPFGGHVFVAFSPRHLPFLLRE